MAPVAWNFHFERHSECCSAYWTACLRLVNEAAVRGALVDPVAPVAAAVVAPVGDGVVPALDLAGPDVGAQVLHPVSSVNQSVLSAVGHIGQDAVNLLAV
eukprot:TRINITY_DN11826_c0_g1_i1.p2 TRINITY_DN11826_c0_g1~~TRINITY_DN11826_c0_g1_i1.p2  ORF type:complete len:100 (-),score=30.90 TRINITY_DN11826_c0_g1_i1:361-660(-)